MQNFMTGGEEMQKEIRIAHTDFELREEAEERKIVGYAALFNSPAEETNGVIEEIAPNAFANAIKKSDTRALINHNAEKVLGRKKAGTLKLQEDEKGLFYEVDPPNTTYANDLMESMRRGDIDQSSFGFVVAEERWDETGEVPVRTIVEVDELFDVSPVTFPWYKNTESGLKSREKVFEEYKANSGEKKTKKYDMKEKLKRKLKLRERNDI